jgi:hypothetical protein
MSNVQETTDIPSLVQQLETSIASQKAFREQHKEVFNQIRMITKTVNTLKRQLQEAMTRDGTNIVTVGNMEVEIKTDTRVKHDINLLKSMMDDNTMFNEYITRVQEDSNKIIARTGKRMRMANHNVEN